MNGSLKIDKQNEKEIFPLIPSQISPNPQRRRATEIDELSTETISESSFSSASFRDEPILNFRNLLEKRHGSVLGRDIILKSEHFFKGMNTVEGELKLFGAPNFRSTNLNIFGAAQPSSGGLATILRVLGCGPSDLDSGFEIEPSLSTKTNKDSTKNDSQESIYLHSTPLQNKKRAIWFSTREEPIIYVNETPFVLRDLSAPFINIKSYTGITSTRLEAVEKRLKADILAEAKRNHGLLLVHDEKDDHGMVPCLISVDSVKTTKEIMTDIQEKGFALDYFRIPVSHEQSPTDPYIDEYFKVFSTTPADWPVVFSCGMGIGRTTYGMVIGLLIRRAQLIKTTQIDPFRIKDKDTNISTAQDFKSRNRTMLRLVYILEQGLLSKQSAQSAIEWILDRSESVDKLEAAVNGNYMVINDLVRVLHNGAICKQIVDSAIDRCDTVVNLREHILLYRVRSLIQNGPFSSLDTGLGFLERYFSLISFCQYVEEQLLLSPSPSGHESFQYWMQNHKEIWKMLTYLRSSNNKLKAFRPLEELHLNDLETERIQQEKQTLKAFISPDLKPSVSEDVAEVQGRSGTVLGPNTILKIDHWQEKTQRSVNTGIGIAGAPNFRRIENFDSPNRIYAVAQPTLSALQQILKIVVNTLPTPRRIVWINVREEPLLYINGEPYVLRDQYASLRNIKAYTGIAANRLEQMELRLKEDVLAESRAHLGRILLHSEGPEQDLLPIWENLQEVNTLRDVFALNSKLSQQYPHLEYYRVPITAEEAPEPADFDTLLNILNETQPAKSKNPLTVTHGSVFIFNCQMGVGRSSMVSVIGMEILGCLDKKINNIATFPVSTCNNDFNHLNRLTISSNETVQYQVITNLIRMLKDGKEAKSLVDNFIDQAGSLINLRMSIEDYRKSANRCSDDRRKCRKFVNRGIQSLKRYALLILFQAFLLECRGQDKGAQRNRETFTDWLQRHQEFGNLVHELESKEVQGLAILSVESEKTALEDTDSKEHVPTATDSLNLSSGSYNKVQAKQKEVKAVVAGRQGAVLAPMTILKFDHFIGCQKQSLLERIDGAPNFRQIPLDNIGSLFVCGLAMPTKEAITRVLYRIDCRPGGQRKCLWISMREEPVIFVNGQPFVLRIVKDPINNLEMTGIVSERVELMETRLKTEAECEAFRYHNRLLLHEEEEIPGDTATPSKFEIVPEWEDIYPNKSLESPAEVYQTIISSGNYPLTYVRVPVTDEQAPIPHVFDELVKLISADSYTDFIFNCQMGRGRTSTGMVIAMLYHRVLTPDNEDLDLLDESFDLTQDISNYNADDNRMKYLQGEYKLIQKLCQLLDQGQRAKKLADACIDACSHLQNLREAIYDHKLRLQGTNSTLTGMTPDRIKETEARGLHYLQRYFYLILFAEYLLEAAHQEQSISGPRNYFPESKHKHKILEKSFLLWLAERREITNLTQKSMTFD